MHLSLCTTIPFYKYFAALPLAFWKHIKIELIRYYLLHTSAISGVLLNTDLANGQGGKILM
jgi:hypothetical protein